MSVDPPDIQSLAADVQVLKTQISGIAANVDGLVARQASFEKAVSESRQFKWPVAISAIGALAVIVTGLMHLIGLKTENAELRGRVETTERLAPISAKAEISERDRSEIRVLIGKNSDRIGESEKDTARIFEKTAEIETQFADQTRIANLRASELHRNISLLWRKCYGEEYPSIIYFPEKLQSGGK